jgi:predicted DNA-binding transcriptional regulator YafY
MPDPLIRQWELLKLIPRDRKITVTELYRKLSDLGHVVSRRTIERDLVALSTPFGLECDDRSKPFGWRYRMNAALLQIPGLSASEALSLVMMERYLKNLLPIAVADNLSPYFQAAQDKFRELNPEQPLQTWLDKVSLVPAGQPLLPPKIDADIQRTVYEAVLKNRQLEMRYQPVSAPRPKRYVPVNPLGLVQQGQVVYLVATVYIYQDPLILAVHRMRSVKLLETPSESLEGFSLQSFIASGAFGFGESDHWIDLDIVFTAGAGEHLLETPLSSNQKAERRAPGEVRIRARVLYTRQLVWWLTGFGPDVDILAPEFLKNEIAERHRAAYTVERSKGTLRATSSDASLI